MAIAYENYAHAVTAVRIKENRLIDNAFLQQLIIADDYMHVREILQSNNIFSKNEDIDTVSIEMQNNVWDFLMEISPDPAYFESLVLENDFHNLKAAIKCHFTKTMPDDYYIYPCTFDTKKLTKIISEKEFDKLPKEMQKAAKNAYDNFVNYQDGQYVDIIIDSAALKAIRRAGRDSSCKMLDEISELVCACANIKTAIRSALTNKDRRFLNMALCAECTTLDKTELIESALSGTDDVLEYLKNTEYADVVSAMKDSNGVNGNNSNNNGVNDFSKSTADNNSNNINNNSNNSNNENSTLNPEVLEKWFDDAKISTVKKSKYIVLGPEPLAAYFIAYQTQMKNLRILLSAKRHNMPKAFIKERMRELYA